MSGLIIKLKKEIIKKNEVDIIIAVESEKDEKLQYRFFESYNGSWKMLKDYSEEDTCQYNMKNEEKCFIMVQGRKINTDVAFDYVERIEYFKRDEKSYFKKVSLKGNKSSNNSELMNFQKIQKRNFAKFEEKMKQKAMEDMLDPLKKVYGLNADNEEVNTDETPKLSVDINKEPVDDEFKAIEIEPEEIETIVEEEQSEEENEFDVEEEQQVGTYEIEIVKDTSISGFNKDEDNISNNKKDVDEYYVGINSEIEEDNSHDEIQMVTNTSKDIDFLTEERKDQICEEELGFIPNYDYLVSEAETKSVEPDNIESNQLKTNEKYDFHTNINDTNIINGEKDIDIQKLINEKFVDKTLAQVDNGQKIIKNQINSMNFAPALTVLDENSEELFIDIPKEKLIKYILTSPRKNYYKGSPIVCTLLCSNPKEVFIKYELYLNEKLIAEKPYSMEKTYAFTPPYEGTYRLVFTGKKADSFDEFKKEKEIFVLENLPVESVGISCDKTTIICNEPVTFMTTVVGGKKVVYEFYLFAENQWQCVQDYSEISYFTLTPQNAGTYKLLIMAKNNNSQNDYDEFVMCKFDVKNQFSGFKGIGSFNL